MTGLATAFYLSKKGIRSTIFEMEENIGGLSSAQQLSPDFQWDKYYHVILTTDKDLLEFLGDIGLSNSVTFSETKTGFYSDGEFHSLSSTMEFLKFKPLKLVDKLRLAIGILYASKLKDWKTLEQIPVKTWLIKVFGRRNFEKLWDPLLKSKLGSASELASAAFIWATIKRLYGTRQRSSKIEMMGCVRDGYSSILNRIREQLEKSGNIILTDSAISKIESSSNNNVRLKSYNGNEYTFDGAVVTVSNPEILKLYSEFPAPYARQLESVCYLGVLCVGYLIKRPLTPFYITNIIDEGFPLTGLIEANHIIPSDLIGERSLIYLPRYLTQDDQFWDKSDDEVFEKFTAVLHRMVPDFNDSDILAWRVNRERYVQPLQDIGYSEKIVDMVTPLNNLFIVNTSMILNSTLNNNQVIQLAKKAADTVERNWLTI